LIVWFPICEFNFGILIAETQSSQR
jgi:hypothetical protein